MREIINMLPQKVTLMLCLAGFYALLSARRTCMLDDMSQSMEIVPTEAH